MRDELTLSRIDKAMYGIAKKVLPQVFTGSRPEANNSKPKAFCVVALNGRLYDNLALGEAVAKFSVFVREKDNGLEDTDGKDTYVNGLLKLLPCTVDGYQFFNPTVLPMGNDEKGFFQYVIYTNLVIV